MRVVKWVLLVLGSLVALAAGALAVFFFVLHPKSRPPQDIKAPSTAEAVERGRYLANHVAACIGCHSDVDVLAPGDPLVPGRAGSGRVWPDIPGFPGRIRAPNLTPAGLGKLSDGEILRAMREGIAHDGRPLFPMMPYTTYARLLGDDDALAIIAYLRTLPPVQNDPGPMEVKFPVSMFMRLAPRPVETPAPPAPPASDSAARGKWLLGVALCGDCHSPMTQGERIAGKEYAGGNAFRTSRGVLYTSNITSDKATGIGSYTDEDLLRVINEGVGKAGQSLYVMPWAHYKGMSDEDKRALIAALRQIPPVSNVVPASTFQR